MMEFKEDVWVCADGTKIPASEMTREHIINAYKWVERLLKNIPERFDKDEILITMNLESALFKRKSFLEEEIKRRVSSGLFEEDIYEILI